MKRLIFLSSVISALVIPTSCLQAEEVIRVFEENDPAWHYTGYWRNSTQGQYGSGGSYAVGRGSQNDDKGYDGQTGPGLATLDLSFLSDSNARIELCYVSHGSGYRSADTRLTIQTAAGDNSLTFSQVGTNNQQVCFDAGIHSNVTELNLSNQTSDSKWATLDLVRVTYEETSNPDDNSTVFRSTFEQGDILPDMPMGTRLVKSVLVNEQHLGFSFSNDASAKPKFGDVIAPLDDLDGNGVRELYVSIDKYQTATFDAWAMILFPDENGNILKHQFIDQQMTRGTSWRHTYLARFGRTAGDFDSNGVYDIVLNSWGQNRFNILLFDRTDQTSEALYKIKGDLEYSNNRGGVPFLITRNSGFGSWVQPVGDLDNNGTLDFSTIYANNDGFVETNVSSRFVSFVAQPGNDGKSITTTDSGFPAYTSNPRFFGDANNDGLPDYAMPLFLGGDEYYLRTLISDGSGGFTENRTRITKTGFQDYALVRHATGVGDINGDGHPDVIVSMLPTFRDYRLQTMELVYLDENQQQLGEPVTLFSDDDFDDITYTNANITMIPMDLDNDGDLDFAINARSTGNGDGFYLMYFE